MEKRMKFLGLQDAFNLIKFLYMANFFISVFDRYSLVQAHGCILCWEQQLGYLQSGKKLLKW